MKILIFFVLLYDVNLLIIYNNLSYGENNQ